MTLKHKSMTLYEESVDWTVETAKKLKLKYKSELEDGETKYFYTKEEAQEYFDSLIEKPYTSALLTYKNEQDFINITVQYR